MKTLRHQIASMRRDWPNFTVTDVRTDSAIWFGSLVGIELEYRLSIQFGLPDPSGLDDTLWRRFPVVRVLTPQLRPDWNAKDEAPLPHVYFERPDISLSPLCLFDPRKREWSHDDLSSKTTVPWAADWLACYEGWLATGRWPGGGRHADADTKRGDA